MSHFLLRTWKMSLLSKPANVGPGLARLFSPHRDAKLIVDARYVRKALVYGQLHEAMQQL